MIFDEAIDKSLSKQFAKTPNRPAILGLDGTHLTFADLNDARDVIATTLTKMGLTPQHRVATLLPGAAQTAILLLGLTTRISVLPLNTALLSNEWNALMDRAGVDALIAKPDDARAIALAIAAGVPLIDVDRFFDGRPNTKIGEPRAQRSPGLVLLTSGSTGHPKMVLTTPKAMIASARNIAKTLSLGPQDRALHALPMFHIGAVVDLLLAPLLSGGSTVICPDRTPTALADGIKVGGATWMQLVPTMLIRCLSELDETALGHMCQPLKFIRSVSADLSAETQLDAEAKCGTPIIQMYGMTETAGQICSNPRQAGLQKPTSVGPAAGPEIAILDASGNLLGLGREGEICTRGATVFAGYEGQSTDDIFFNGWFRTGDLGHIDKDGYLFLTGRKKEMINQGGEKISPFEIERAALSCVGVNEAAAYPLPHPSLGDQPGLTVVGSVDQATVLAHLTSQLADYKCPRHVNIINKMPRLGAGKVDKQTLIKLDQVGPQMPATETYEGQALAIAKLWAATLQTDLPHRDTDFFDAGGDSLAATTFILALEKLTDGPVDPNLLFNAPVFGDLMSALSDVAGIKTADEPIVTYVRQMMAGWPGTPTLTDGIIRSLGTASAGQPVFWCGTEGYQGKVMQEALGNRHPVHTMMSTSQFTGRDESDRVTLAAHFAAEIQAISPTGPLVLGGFCDGGRVMVHAAEILQNAGRTIRCFIAVDHWFDAPTTYPVFHIFSRDVRYSGANFYLHHELAYRVLHPNGVAEFLMPSKHGLNLTALANLSVMLTPLLDGQKEFAHTAASNWPFSQRQNLYKARLKVAVSRLTSPGAEMTLTATVTNCSDHTWPATKDSGFCLVAHAWNFDNRLRKRNAASAVFKTPLAAGETRVVKMTGKYPDIMLPTIWQICVADQGICDFSKASGGQVRRIIWPLPNFRKTT